MESGESSPKWQVADLGLWVDLMHLSCAISIFFSAVLMVSVFFQKSLVSLASEYYREYPRTSRRFLSFLQSQGHSLLTACINCVNQASCSFLFSIYNCAQISNTNSWRPMKARQEMAPCLGAVPRHRLAHCRADRISLQCQLRSHSYSAVLLNQKSQLCEECNQCSLHAGCWPERLVCACSFKSSINTSAGNQSLQSFFGVRSLSLESEAYPWSSKFIFGVRS